MPQKENKKVEDKISKHKKYGFVYGIRNKTPVGRLAWVNVVKPKESTFPVEEGQTAPPPRYEVTFLLDKKDPKVKAFMKQLDIQKEEMVELFNFDEKTGKPKKSKISVDEVVKDGDELDTEKYPFYAGHYYIVPKHADRPDIFDVNVDEVLPENVFGGMKALLVVRPICTAHGISYQLLTIQLAKDDGVRFGGGNRDSKDLLGQLDDDGDDADPIDDDDDEEAPATVQTKSKSKSQKGDLNLNKLA